MVGEVGGQFAFATAALLAVFFERGIVDEVGALLAVKVAGF